MANGPVDATDTTVAPWVAGEVGHAGLDGTAGTCKHRLGLRLIEGVTHADEEGALHHRHLFIRGVGVRCDAIAGRHGEFDDERAGLAGVPADDGHLGPGGKYRRRGAPLEVGCRARGLRGEGGGAGEHAGGCEKKGVTHTASSIPGGSD